MFASRSLRARRWAFAAVFGGVTLCSTGTALAIFGEDIPILVEIATTEAASYVRLGTLLTKTAALIQQVKEQTTLVKTAWGAIEELTSMTPSELRRAALAGIRNGLPQLDTIYGGIQDIGDLKYRDYRAYATLRGMLWEEIYGPGIDYLHTGHDSLNAVAGMQDQAIRQQALAAARSAQAEQWREDCERSLGAGQLGACQAAASQATILQSEQLASVNQNTALILDAQRRTIERADREELDRIYAFDRWLEDLHAYMRATAGVEADCRAGECLYERYGHKMYARIARYRRQHPQGE